MAKTKFTDKDHLEHFKKQLALRDTYVKENADYIETKRDEIGLSTSETLAELCFALHLWGFFIYRQTILSLHI